MNTMLRIYLLLLFQATAISSLHLYAANIPLPERGLCAHRGASATHPENTIPAFIEAARLGAQMIEFDIRLTKDGVLVLMHDETVDRTTNGKGKVSDLTLAEIKQLDAGSWKDTRFTGTRIPTFEEALAVMPQQTWLNCHLKGGAEAGAVAAAAIKKAGRTYQAFLACGEAAAIAARKVNPAIRICNMEDRYRKNIDEYVKGTLAMKADFLQLIRDDKGVIPEEATRLLKAHKININYYYAKDTSELAGLFASGADFVLVDDLAKFIPAARTVGITANVRPRTILFFFDGLRTDYITPEAMPNLYKLKKEWSFNQSHHSVFPTVTRVNASSYATGSYPKTHGIMGNTVYFPKVNKIKGLDTGEAENLEAINESTEGQLLTSISIGEVLQNAGERMMVFSSGSTGQAFLQNHKISGGAIVHPEMTLPESFRKEVISVMGNPPAKTKLGMEWETWVTDAFIRYVLQPNGPAVGAIWLTFPDGAAHAHGVGSPEAMVTIKGVDEQLGRILSAIKNNGMEDLFNVIITTDHGFVTYAGKENLAGMLIQGGFKANMESDDVIVSDGAVYVKDHEKEKIKQIVAYLQQQPSTGALFTPGKNEKDLKGWVPGTMSFSSVHWNHKTRAADILVDRNWNDDKNALGYAGTGFSKGVAGHGGLSPYEVSIPLIAYGPCFKKEFVNEWPTCNVDIVPTILYTLQIPVPEVMDGRVMKELLRNETLPALKPQKEITEVSSGNYHFTLERTLLGNYKYVDRSHIRRD